MKGHTTGFEKVAVTTERENLRAGLKGLIGIGRQVGGPADLRSHIVNHSTTIYHPDFLLQQDP